MIEIIKNNENVVLLDVEVLKSLKKDTSGGSINIPVYDLLGQATKKIKKKESIIIVYCSAGIRSKRAVQILRKLGYRNLYNIEGGIENL